VPILVPSTVPAPLKNCNNITIIYALSVIYTDTYDGIITINIATDIADFVYIIFHLVGCHHHMMPNLDFKISLFINILVMSFEQFSVNLSGFQ